MTIEKGYIPLNIGIFEDHEINKCAIEVDTQRWNRKKFK